MERADPLFLLMGLPTIPVVLVLGRLIRWEDYVLRVWRKYSSKLQALQALVPGAGHRRGGEGLVVLWGCPGWGWWVGRLVRGWAWLPVSRDRGGLAAKGFEGAELWGEGKLGSSAISGWPGRGRRDSDKGQSAGRGGGQPLGQRGWCGERFRSEPPGQVAVTNRCLSFPFLPVSPGIGRPVAPGPLAESRPQGDHTSLSRSLCGALVFPTIASLVGRLLFRHVDSSLQRTILVSPGPGCASRCGVLKVRLAPSRVWSWRLLA